MASTARYPRLAEESLHEMLMDSPAVLIHGPRQCGKTTLAQKVGKKLRATYITFDDEASRAFATGDPVGFVANLPRRVILDEVQHVPQLFAAIKVAVDRERVPGRFLLTGSTNVLLLPKLADSLAGRLAILRLHPLAQCELARRVSPFIDRLFNGGFKVRPWKRLGRELPERIAAGGYPAALALPAGRRRSRWYADYVETIVQSDVRELARIASLNLVPRLLGLVAANTARLVNFTDLARPLQVSRPTLRDYVTLLERVFLAEQLPPWHVNRASRLIKTPKLHIGDTGLACALLGTDAAGLAADRGTLGQLVETFVLQELRRQASSQELPLSFLHYRDRDDYEVDVVLERGVRAVAGVEVKSGGTVIAADFRGLRKLKEVCGSRFAGGVVLYDGEISGSFGDRLYAVPLRALWELE